MEMTKVEGWNPRYIEELNTRKQNRHLGGGKDRIEKQHRSGKLTARERIALLFDSGSFNEVDGFSMSSCVEQGMNKKKIAGDGVITGWGTVDGKTAFVAAQDFTVIGGTLGKVHGMKICRVLDMAYSMQAPFIFINDSGGARIEEGVDSLAGYSSIFKRNAKYSGVIPQIALIMGTCAGGACYLPALCDYVFMTRNTSKMFITGPRVVKEVIGEEITDDELGSADIHAKVSGVADFVCEDEKALIEKAKKLLSYLTKSDTDISSEDEKTENIDAFEKIVPDNQRHVYDVRDVINLIVDKQTFFEVKKEYAPNIVIGYARICGHVTGIVANQPMVMGGALDAKASEKAARFIRHCDCFSIPILTLVDTPGFWPGRRQEREGIIRRGAKLLYAYAETEVPKVTLVIRKAYGGAYIAMGSKNIGADIVYAWPIAQLAVMGAEGAVEIIYRREIAVSAQPSEEKKRKVLEYENKFMTPYLAAEQGHLDEVIAPDETRRKIAKAFLMLSAKVFDSNRKHGNIPL